MKILVDADACPVKAEVYRVAQRHGVPVVVVSNSPLTVPPVDSITLELTSGRFDAADDRIVELAEAGDVVVSGDVALAARCLAKGASLREVADTFPAPHLAAARHKLPPMKTVRNLSMKPLAVPLPGGRKLHLGPSQRGEISTNAAKHPPLLALVTAGELEIGEGGHAQASSTASGGAAHATTTGFRQAAKSSRRGDR